MSRFLVVAILLAGCSAASTNSTSPPASVAESASPTPSVEASAATTESPSSEAGTDGALCAEGFEMCTLVPGTYSAAPFEPGFMFTIDEEWTNDRAYADGGGISLGNGGIYWASGVAEGNVGNETVEIGAGADEFVAFLQSLATIGMTVSGPTDVTVGGVDGRQIDVETNDVEARALYLIQEDAFNLVPQEKARFMAFDIDGETAILIVDSFAVSDFDEWVEIAQPVVDTIAWE